jgi:hypothetical protein
MRTAAPTPMPTPIPILAVLLSPLPFEAVSSNSAAPVGAGVPVQWLVVDSQLVSGKTSKSNAPVSCPAKKDPTCV